MEGENYGCQRNVFYSSLRSKSFYFYRLTDINECESEPCVNGGECIDKVGRYICSCPGGYEGVDCQGGLCRA